MTAPAPPPAPGGPGQQITVTPENVLAARRVIGQAAQDAREKLLRMQYQLRINRAADDEISTAAALVWNKNLVSEQQSHYQRLVAYVDEVERLGGQLEEAAKQYGFTEEEVAASFRTSGVQV